MYTFILPVLHNSSLPLTAFIKESPNFKILDVCDCVGVLYPIIDPITIDLITRPLLLSIRFSRAPPFILGRFPPLITFMLLAFIGINDLNSNTKVLVEHIRNRNRELLPYLYWCIFVCLF